MTFKDAVGTDKRRLLAEPHIVHAIIVILVITAATIYAVISRDHSGNVWVVYGAGVGSGAARATSSLSERRRGDEA